MAGRGFRSAFSSPTSARAGTAHFEPLEERRLLSTLDATSGRPARFADVDGDIVTVIHKNHGGTQIILNDDTGVCEEIRTTGGLSDRTVLVIKVKAGKDGDGRLSVDVFDGDNVHTINAPDVDIVGDFFFFNEVRNVRLGSITGEAQFITNRAHAGSMRVQIDTINTTGVMVLLEDVSLLRVNEWFAGQLEIGGGVSRVIIDRTFAGSLLTDRGGFYDPTFRRGNFFTRQVRFKSIAQGTVSMPRTFLGSLVLLKGSTEDFSFTTSDLGGRTIISRSTFEGTLTMNRPINRFIVLGHVDGDINLNSVNLIRVGGNVAGTFNCLINRVTRIGGDLDGAFVASYSRNVVIDGDMNGRATFLRNSTGGGIGFQRFLVNGAMNDARLTSRANMGNVIIRGGMFGSHIAAGAHPNELRNEFPANLDDLKTSDQYKSAYIRSVNIGYNNSGDVFFEQSYILAFELLKVRLGYAAPEELDSPTFGVGSMFLHSIIYRNAEGTTKRSDLHSFRLTDGKFRVARIPGSFPVDE